MAKTDGRAKTVSHQNRTTTADDTVELGWTHKITVDGVDYHLHESAVSALDDGELLKASSGVIGVADALFTRQTAGSLVAVAGFIWLARRQHGERNVSFAEVARGLTIGSMASLVVDRVDSDPEA